MALQSCCSCRSPRRCWDYCLWAGQRSSHIDCTFFWRVSEFTFGNCGAAVLITNSQPFWGNMVASAGAGPQPIPYRSLTVENLSRAIVKCLEPETRSAARVLAAKMETEDGVRTAVASFHRHLPRDIQCQVLPDQAAAWTYKSNRTNIRLSKRTVGALIKASVLKPSMLTP
jgi:hypothetical protein